MSCIRVAVHAVLICVGVVLPAEGQEQWPAGERQLRPGDAVRVALKDEAQLGGDFVVAADGYVLMPVIGKMHVGGRPFAEVAAELAAAYAVELHDPVVQITPLLRIAVLGEVRQPGLLMIDPTHGLADVLALAGGLTELGDRARISLVRDGQSVEGRLDPTSPTSGTHLRSGDQLYVGRQNWFNTNSAILIGAAASFATAAVTSLLIR